MTSISSNSLSYTLLQQAQQAQKQQFQKADTDQSGGLSLSEFTASAPAGSTDTSALETMFTSFDGDSDGNLSESEIETGLAAQKPPSQSLLSSDTMMQLLAGMEEKLTEFFNAADQDGDGSLSESEFTTAFESSGASAPPPSSPPPAQGGGSGGSSSQSSEVYDALDTNKDGTVSLDELLASSESDEDNSSDDTASSLYDFTGFLLKLQEQQYAA